MSCKCGSERIAYVSAKCSDMCNVSIGAKELNDCVPRDMGIGHGDYVEFSYCLDCGQIQGEFPLEKTDLEGSEEEEDPLYGYQSEDEN